MDKNRILVKLDEIDGYLRELDDVVPASVRNTGRARSNGEPWSGCSTSL
jgi:hypothetical protein